MPEYAVDTQVLVRFLEGKPAPSALIQQTLEGADRGDHQIVIPVIVLMEVLYLFEKRRITKSILDVEDLLSQSSNYRVELLTLEILKEASSVRDTPELHDRLIGATAAHLGIPLLTNDPDLRTSAAISTP